MGGEQCGNLRCIDRRPAADADKAVVAALACERDRVEHRALVWLDASVREHVGGDVTLADGFADELSDA